MGETARQRQRNESQHGVSSSLDRATRPLSQTDGQGLGWAAADVSSRHIVYRGRTSPFLPPLPTCYSHQHERLLLFLVKEEEAASVLAPLKSSCFISTVPTCRCPEASEKTNLSRVTDLLFSRVVFLPNRAQSRSCCLPLTASTGLKGKREKMSKTATPQKTKGSSGLCSTSPAPINVSSGLFS